MATKRSLLAVGGLVGLGASLVALAGHIGIGSIEGIVLGSFAAACLGVGGAWWGAERLIRGFVLALDERTSAENGPRDGGTLGWPSLDDRLERLHNATLRDSRQQTELEQLVRLLRSNGEPGITPGGGDGATDLGTLRGWIESVSRSASGLLHAATAWTNRPVA